MSETNHPWCRDVRRDEAIRAAEDTAAAERTPLPDHRDLPAAVAELRERVAALEDHFADASKMVTPPQPAPVTPADGLRTEPVTLRERTPGEASAYAEGMAATVVADLIRERNAAREECERRLTMCESMKRDLESAQFNVSCLKARVAELEAAAAATAGGEVKQEPPRGWLTAEERSLVESLRATFQQNADALRSAGPRGHVDNWERRVLLLDAILARSTPPRVKVPEWMHDDVRRAVVAAIREAGGEVE